MQKGELVFLGTGGGRFNLVSQVRRTGGFRINGDLNIHVDPGPGALISSLAYSQDPTKINWLIVTHNHIDHTNDAGLMIEAMDRDRQAHRCGIIASKSILSGDEYKERTISSYHTNKLSEKIIARHGSKILFPKKNPKASLAPIPVRHEDKTGFGFVLSMNNRKIGYTSDTEYYSGMGVHYSGCDILVVNNLKARADNVPGHMCSKDTARLLSQAKPKLALLSHMGLRLIRASPEREAARIQAESGVRTVAAKDGMRISLSSLKIFFPSKSKRQ
ncbi:MAG: MBL fold metallo-hydrolase [Candidatus Micrarchaeota archaeon]|nr:MBL fold metallo-hydrolase [Candidatus Micrarchaeota archaeon]